MSLLATTTVAALLIANPVSGDADRIAANAGFLLGNAHRCGIDNERIVRAGRLVHDLIIAAAADDKEQEDATTRYATFFIVSAYPNQGKEKIMASCKIVTKKLVELEKHPLPEPRPVATVGNTDEPAFKPSDGE
jgi:hypothetical protein